MSSLESDLVFPGSEAAVPLGANSSSKHWLPAERWAAAPQVNPALESGVQQEPGWLARSLTDQGDPLRILVCRWRHSATCIHAHESDGDPSYGIVALTLQPTEVKLVVDGQCVLDGGSAPGMAFLSPAGSRARVNFHGPCDFVHLYVPTARLDRIALESGGPASVNQFKRSTLWAADAAVERLAWLLLKAGDLDAESGALYLDGIAQAILARLLDEGAENGHQRKRNPSLLKWRLKRVIDFIETNLSCSLRLSELAKCTGLSRMHFAAQFRASTGLQPHEYVVHRRIQCAQEILSRTDMPLVEVALAVGFQTQAHFTTVFRRLSGETPGRWRQLQRLDDAEKLASQRSA